MKNRTKPAITILALAALSHVTSAQAGGDKMAKPMGKAKTYTGCIEAGAGTFTLTHATTDMGMGKGAMDKDARAPETLTISSNSIDLSKHVGHKVSVTGSETAMGKAKHDEMGKSMPALSITSIKMIATTCTM